MNEMKDRFQCEECGEVFSTSTGLAIHVGRKHQKREDFEDSPDLIRDVSVNPDDVHVKVGKLLSQLTGLDVLRKVAAREQEITVKVEISGPCSEILAYEAFTVSTIKRDG